MIIYLRDQQESFYKHLEYFKTKNVMQYDRALLKEKSSSIQIVSSEQKILDILFAYKIFPPNIMTYKTEWEIEGRKMRAGDTIVQQVYIPPVTLFSQKLVFAVRVNEIIDQPSRKGFSYETLEGHAERGISTFTIEELEGKTFFRIHTRSVPGNILTKLMGPFFSVPYQTYCTNQALKNVKQQAEKI